MELLNMLRKNYVHFKDEIDVSGGIIDFMFQERSIEYDDKEEITACTNRPSRNGALLDKILKSNSEEKAETFFNALKKYYPKALKDCNITWDSPKAAVSSSADEEKIKNHNMLDKATSKKSRTKFKQYFIKAKEATREIDLLIIGKTGNGKSATGNAILRDRKFKTDACCNSVTKRIQRETTRFEDMAITVFDGPGIGDTSSIDDVEQATIIAVESMKNAMTLNPKGFHAFILVVKFGNRFTAEDKECIRLLKHIFGEDFIRHYCILLVTHGDTFKQYEKEQKKTFETWCQEQEGNFHTLFTECENRAVLFNNVTSNKHKKETQLEELLKLVNNLQFVGRRYDMYKFEQTKQSRNYIVIQSKASVIQEEIMRETSLIMADKSEQYKNNLLDVQIMTALMIRLDSIHKRLEDEDKGTKALENIIKYVNDLKADFEATFHILEKQAIYEEGKNKIDQISQEKEKSEQNYQRLLVSQRSAAERYSAAKIKEEKLLRENETKRRKDLEMKEKNLRDKFQNEYYLLLHEKSKLEEECKLIVENKLMEVTKRNEQIDKLRKIINENDQRLKNIVKKKENEMRILQQEKEAEQLEYKIEKESSRKRLEEMYKEKHSLKLQLEEMRKQIIQLQQEVDKRSRDFEEIKKNHKQELIKCKTQMENSELKYNLLKQAQEEYILKIWESEYNGATEKLGQQLMEAQQQLQQKLKHHSNITQNLNTNMSEMKQQNQQSEESMSKLADRSETKTLKTPALAEGISRSKQLIEKEQQKYKQVYSQHKEIQELESEIVELSTKKVLPCSVQ